MIVLNNNFAATRHAPPVKIAVAGKEDSHVVLQTRNANKDFVSNFFVAVAQ